MKVEIEVLRTALNKLLDHAKEAHGESINVEADLYWFVPEGLLSDPDVEPKELTLGSLDEDWSEVAAIGRGEKEPLGYALVWASSVLRAAGDRTN